MKTTEQNADNQQPKKTSRPTIEQRAAEFRERFKSPPNRRNIEGFFDPLWEPMFQMWLQELTPELDIQGLRSMFYALMQQLDKDAKAQLEQS